MSTTTGYDKLKKAVIKDCNDKGSCGCFNENGCDKCNSAIGKYGEETYKHCFHAYCDKFKWVIDRAKHYGEKLNMDWMSVLDEWEKRRDYWYMNYYQDCNQPLIENINVRVFETKNDYKQSLKGKGFRCPNCGGVSTNPYECNSKEIKDGKICNWKSYGLFRTMGKGVTVVIKKPFIVAEIFMPIAWEEDSNK